jgi:hypothetical protein
VETNPQHYCYLVIAKYGFFLFRLTHIAILLHFSLLHEKVETVATLFGSTFFKGG